MAKPKGGTLTRLFEVSEKERLEFYQNIQKKIQPIGQTAPEEMELPKTGVSAKGTPVRKAKIRRALQVQDGHSLGEQLVLTTLWNEADVVEGKPYRRITIGYRTLSGICGLNVNNCKANLKSLQNKLALELEAGYSSNAATTYRVFSFSDILQRRESAGMTHVLRNRGALFVNHETGIPVSGTPPGVVSTPPPVPVSTPPPGVVTGTPPRMPILGVSLSESIGSGAKRTHAPFFNTKKEEQAKEEWTSVVGVVSSSLRKHIAIDDDAVRQIVDGCREQDPRATAGEIAHFSELKILQHRRNRKVQNLPGLLIHSVRDYFVAGSGELARFREAQRQARETAEREQKESERRYLEFQEQQRQILENPHSTDEDKRFARQYLGLKVEAQSS